MGGSKTTSQVAIRGRDPLPDSWFSITNTGATGDTITIDIAATTNDPSTPDRDLPAFSKIFTTLVGEVGDDVALATRMVSEINLDAGALSSEISAILVEDDENAVVFITSKKSGEFFERVGTNDFTVTVTGTALVNVGFDNFIQRFKESELARSSTDPRRGVLGVSGSITAQTEGRPPMLLFLEDSSNSQDMSIDGSSVPVEFKISNNADYDNTMDLLVTQLRMHAVASSIDTGAAKYIEVPVLTNGHLITIRSDNDISYSENLKLVEDIQHRFSIGANSKFQRELGAGQPSLTAEFNNPFFIRKTGTFPTADDVTVTVRDDLSTSSILRLEMAVVAFEV